MSALVVDKKGGGPCELCFPSLLAIVVALLGAFGCMLQAKVWQGFTIFLLGLLFALVMQWTCSINGWISWILLVCLLVIYILIIVL